MASKKNLTNYYTNRFLLFTYNIVNGFNKNDDDEEEDKVKKSLEESIKTFEENNLDNNPLNAVKQALYTFVDNIVDTVNEVEGRNKEEEEIHQHDIDTPKTEEEVIIESIFEDIKDDKN